MLVRTEPVLREQLVARRVAAFVRIERAEARQRAVFDRAGRKLPGAVPARGVAQLADAHGRRCARRERQLVPKLVLVPVIGMLERAVRTADFGGKRGLGRAQGRARDRQGSITELAVAG